MHDTLRNWRRGFLCAMLGFTAPLCAAPPDLGQSWSGATKDAFYYTTQGSRLVPRDWLLVLERHDTQDLFLADGLARFGYLPGAKTALNGDQLPIGFAVDPAPNNERWIGMTCAACHTNEVTYRGTSMRVDGAPGGADMYDFLAKLDLALQKAAGDDVAFLRFAQRVLGPNDNDANRKNLREDPVKGLKAFSGKFAVFVQRSTPKTARWGPARLDAFGMIFNRVASIDLDDYAPNSLPPDAPVSYPFLWGSSSHDVTQWNGAVDNSSDLRKLARNYGQVLGVFGTIDMKGSAPYRNSVQRSNLGALEKAIAALTAPVWPAAVLGTPDPARVARGQIAFKTNCTGCHQLLPRNNQLQQVKIKLVPAALLGTDDAMTRISATRTSETRFLAGRKMDVLFGDRMKDVEKTTDILSHAVIGAMMSFGATGSSKSAVNAKLFTPSVAIGNYKARPLNGIWATGPYLHNGSVRTLYQLLLPENQRDPKFLVGSREFDPDQVGFANAAATWPGAVPFEFDTGLTGNGNRGHLYGTGVGDDDRKSLVEFMKTL